MVFVMSVEWKQQKHLIAFARCRTHSACPRRYARLRPAFANLPALPTYPGPVWRAVGVGELVLISRKMGTVWSI